MRFTVVKFLRTLAVLVLFSALFLPYALAATATVAWTPNPPEEGVVGYKVYYGPTSRLAAGFTTYSGVMDASASTRAVVAVPDPSRPTYFSVTAYTAGGIESGYSSEVVRTPVYYSVAASASTGGSLSPSGNLSFVEGSTPTFTLVPSAGYRISDLIVDGVSQGALSTFTFPAIASSHTIQAVFAPSPTPVTITATAGAGGSIAPSGAVSVPYGGSQSFVATASVGYQVADFKVDGVSRGAISSCTFTAVDANHTVEVTFTPTQLVLTASARIGGSITPSGEVAVPQGGSQSFAVAAFTDYRIYEVRLDRVSQGPLFSLSLTNIDAPHKIEAIFATKKSRPNEALSAAGTQAESVAEIAGGAGLEAPPFLPVSGGVVSTLTPTLVTVNPVPSEGEGAWPVTFEFQVAEDPGMTGIVASVGNLPQEPWITAWTLPRPLENGKRYYWRVRANDGSVSSAWSPTANFLVGVERGPTLSQLELFELVLATEGGVLESTPAEGLPVRVEVPPDAVAQDFTLTVGRVENAPPPSGNMKRLGAAYELGPHGTDAAWPLSIALPCPASVLAAAGVGSTEEMRVFAFDDATLAWEELDRSSYRVESDRVVMDVSRFSLYALGAATDPAQSPDSGSAGGGGGCFLRALGW